MDFAKNNGSMILVLVMAFSGLCYGAVYKVGDGHGWTGRGVDYNAWAATKSFHVGDVINFEYDPRRHNVVRVKHREFQTCNISDPISVTVSGRDQIKIDKPGHYYFICGVPGHCQAGQKVDIRVASNGDHAPSPSHSAASPSPSSGRQPTAYPPTVVADSPSPTPSKNTSNALSLHSSKHNHFYSSQLLVAIAVLSFFAF